ncbi:MAG: hypothetical protein M1817_004879 [Caeruleum heppii]|nr:MAG: hypothetical protein M1817_004879 [Caeruleum heppii]
MSMSSPTNTRNPFAFTSWPVIIFSSVIYAALFISLLVVHLNVPTAPKTPTPVLGINITEAWRDLQELTSGYHPYNSRNNDEVRDWLLRRIESILEKNGAKVSSRKISSEQSLERHIPPRDRDRWSIRQDPTRLCDKDETSAERDHRLQERSAATIFNDLMSNVSFSATGRTDSSGHSHMPGQSVYFEGTNIMVYVHGTEDENLDCGPRSLHDESSQTTRRRGGVLVNAHYDSVSTGYGATDDGVGVVTNLQLIKYYTTTGNTPRRGLVVLFNNGEEDFLNGARAFSQHPISKFVRTFLNLEGAGAGGRAALFRSTDTEVTKPYRNCPFPFGSVVGRDGFERGLIRSQTDYVVFNGILGLRGLDVAFMEPRARYHTDQDDLKHTSKDSLWHMLSAALATTKGLTSDRSHDFDVSTNRHERDQGSDGVWFDLYGQAFAILQLDTLFAISLTLLIITPLVVVLVAVLLSRQRKWYFFSHTVRSHTSNGEEKIHLHGWRGFTRFPVAVVAATAAAVGLAFLVTKVNPLIVYSSPHAVWSMMLTAWFLVAWFVLRGADFIRPSALYRGYAVLWMFFIFWVLLLVAAVLMKRMRIAGVYFVMFYFDAVFVATLISLLECFHLPAKDEFAAATVDYTTGTHSPHTNSPRESTLVAPEENPFATEQQRDADDEDEGEPTESTSLLRGNRQTTFAHYTSPHRAGPPDTEDDAPKETPNTSAHGQEQAWSSPLPTWTWLIQLLFLAPFPVILVGQIALLVTSAMYQTGVDGSSSLIIYLFIAIFTVLLLLPLAPFLHRFTSHIPLLFLLILIATTLYNLLAFPFSANNRYKAYFIQTVDLESGQNTVSLSGLESFIRPIIAELPSAAGQPISCASDPDSKAGLTRCSWSGIPPQVVPSTPPGVPPELGYPTWVRYNVTRYPHANSTSAVMHLAGQNTRACKILFHRPISDFRVSGAGDSDLFARVPKDGGSKELRLWSREWGRGWTVFLDWSNSTIRDGESSPSRSVAEGTGMDGHVVCLWSDANMPGTIGALDEVRRYAPDWVAVSKLGDGLVEGRRPFVV